MSPVSRGGSGEIVEGEDASMPERDGDQADEEDGEEEESQDALRPLDRRRRAHPSSSPRMWRRQIESALTKISTEISALKEQIDELNSSSSSSYYNKSGFNIGRRKGTSRVLAWMRWILWMAIRQLAVDAFILGLLLLWGVWKRDDRFEKWVGRRWTQLRRLMEGLRMRYSAKWDFDWTGMVLRIVPARFL